MAALEARSDCAWRQLPMPLHFHCGSANIEDVEELSPEYWRMTLDHIAEEPSILGVRAYGLYSSRLEPDRADLADARAQAVADFLADRYQLASDGEGLGSGFTAHPCTCEFVCERFVQVAVLRCDRTATRSR